MSEYWINNKLTKMTKEEAVLKLIDVHAFLCRYSNPHDKWTDAVNIGIEVIKRVEQEPTTKKDLAVDTISREKPTEARYEALLEEIFRRECTTKGVIWYSGIEDILPVFCDHYKCLECPIGNDVCDRANKGQIELETALKRELTNLGFEGDDVQYFGVTREELRDAIKARKNEVIDAIKA